MSPFKSLKQQKWMFSNKPTLAKKWASEFGAIGKGIKLKAMKAKKVKKYG